MFFFSMEAAYFSELDGFDPTLFELEGLELKAEHPDLVLISFVLTCYKNVTLF
jgi:hypothetical protein